MTRDYQFSIPRIKPTGECLEGECQQRATHSATLTNSDGKVLSVDMVCQWHAKRLEDLAETMCALTLTVQKQRHA